MYVPLRKLRSTVASILGTDPSSEDGNTRRADADEDGSEPSPSDLSEAEFLVERGVTRSDYLIDLLRRNGGRLSQTEVSAAIGWSPSTASRRLAELEDEGVVRRYRVGKENVVVLSSAAPGGILSRADG